MSKLKSILLLVAAMIMTPAHADRIKDLTDVAGVRSNQLVGFGLVSGLSQTGDGKDLPLTAQGSKDTSFRHGCECRWASNRF